jgi:hypothetical protein
MGRLHLNPCVNPRSGLLAVLLLLALVTPAAADQDHPDPARKVGEKSPLFAVATSQGTLSDYTRSYYGRHHLILSFFAAAFTPI